jgi:SEC-C motif domain protein
MPYAACCGRWHAGEPAATAEELMRSRFAAFARGLGGYLLATWHPSTRPPELTLDDTAWRRLQIVDTVAGREGDAEGVVEFRASYRTAAGAGLLHERSRFVREGGRWLYLDGDLLD